MDPVTHALSGLVGLNAVKKRLQHGWDRYGWVFFVATLAPDLDYVSRFFGTATYLKYHRGPTHSLVLGVAFSLLVSAILRRIVREWNFSKGALFLYFGILLHIYLDLITGFGTQIFFPFSKKRYYLDWVFIIDPFFTMFLFVGLLLTKITGRFEKAVAVFLIVYPLFCGFLKSRVPMESICSRDSRNVEILPDFLAPCFWKVICEKDDYLEIRRFSFLQPGLDGNSKKFQKLDVDEFKGLRLKFRELKIFFEFSRFPVVFEEDKENGVYIWADAQFITTWRSNAPFLFVVVQENSGHFIRAGFR